MNQIATYEPTWIECEGMALAQAGYLISKYTGRPDVRAFPVPNAGVYAALLMKEAMLKKPSILKPKLELVEHPDEADCYIDDIIDSGNTRLRMFRFHGEKPFYALHTKHKGDGWVSFPWDRMSKSDGPHDNIKRILQYIGEDPDRDGLKETPDRVVRSYAELFSGYKQEPAILLKTFEEDGYDEIVLLADTEFTSMCEHHMLPFTGKAHIAYIPQGRVLGLSKLARVLEVFSRRLQIQERLTVQITQALDEYLKPQGSACVIEASHSCIACRGVQKQHSMAVTSSMTGAFRDKPEARSELMSMIYGR